jgi:Ca-activated chloride channel family protein
VGDAGRGSADVVLPDDPGAAEAAADRFVGRLDAPVLTNLRVEANGLPVTDLGPERLPDLFPGRPLVLVGRYGEPAEGDLILRGTVGAREVAIPVHVVLPETYPAHEALAPLWARVRIRDLARRIPDALAEDVPALREALVATALEFRLVSPATSFVAVDEGPVRGDGDPETLVVPHERPRDTR